MEMWVNVPYVRRCLDPVKNMLSYRVTLHILTVFIKSVFDHGLDITTRVRHAGGRYKFQRYGVKCYVILNK